MTASLVGLLEAAGLSGRGGAGFSTATKVRAAATEGASLIVNACDGEYGAVKDGYVVEYHLSELVRGAELLGRNGIRMRRRAGAGPRPGCVRPGWTCCRSHTGTSPRRSALVSLTNAGLARPMTKRVPVVFRSVSPEGRRLPPTVVLNAETVWRVAQIAERGADWFRSLGTQEEPGPRLASVSGAVPSPGVVEIAAGVEVSRLIEAAGESAGASPASDWVASVGAG
jgi:NADH:ubiquinone oxidoreductase subunit F (NADH-binding)